MVRDVDLFIQTHQNPEGRRYSINATPLLDASGLVCGAVAVGRDVTELRVAHRELQEMARTDALTGAYNRFGFMQVARDAPSRARQASATSLRWSSVDLNGMKRINDSLGHLQGDQLLSDVMTILRGCFRSSDIIGRLGGDEFVVLSPDAGESAESFRGRLRAAVDEYNARSALNAASRSAWGSRRKRKWARGASRISSSRYELKRKCTKTRCFVDRLGRARDTLPSPLRPTPTG